MTTFAIETNINFISEYYVKNSKITWNELRIVKINCIK
jgi:hypothetical protein